MYEDLPGLTRIYPDLSGLIRIYPDLPQIYHPDLPRIYPTEHVYEIYYCVRPLARTDLSDSQSGKSEV